MDTITIRVSVLAQIVANMQEDGMEFVQLMLIEPSQGDPGFVSFSAIKASEPDMIVDYETIDDLPEQSDLFDQEFLGSNNLQ